MALPARVSNPETVQSIRGDWCERCGKPGPVQEHHIKTRGSGGSDIPLNKIGLCFGCHRGFHDGKIDRYEFVVIVARREGITPEDVCKAIGIPVPDQFPEVQEPSLAENKGPSLEELIQAYITLEEQERDCKWTKGQLLDAMLNAGAKAKWIAAQVGTSAAQIRELVKVYRAFPEEGMRIPELSWYHHRVAANTDDPATWIEKAAEEQLSTRQLRKAILEEDEKKGEAPLPDDDEENKKRHRAEKALQVIDEILAAGGEVADWVKKEMSDRLS